MDFAPVAAPRNFEGKLCSALTATTGRFGRAALRPIYELIAEEGGAIPRSVKDCLRRRASVLPTVDSSLVLSLRRRGPADPEASQRPGRPRRVPADRIYSDAAGSGELANTSFLSRDDGHLPALLVAQPDQMLQDLEATSDEIYIFEFPAEVATVPQFRCRL